MTNLTHSATIQAYYQNKSCSDSRITAISQDNAHYRNEKHAPHERTKAREQQMFYPTHNEPLPEVAADEHDKVTARPLNLMQIRFAAARLTALRLAAQEGKPRRPNCRSIARRAA